MRRWFHTWNGHILSGFSIALALVILLFVWRAARGFDAETIWWNFLVAVGVTFVFLVVTAFAAILYKGPYERWYIRNQERVAEIPLTPVGAPRMSSPTPNTETGSQAVSEAQSLSEEGSDQ